MAALIQFNPDIWNFVLEYQEEYSKLPKQLTLCEKFGISQKQSIAYTFAAKHLDLLNKNLNDKLETVNSKFTTLRADHKTVKAELAEEIARNRFIEATKMQSDYAFNRITLPRLKTRGEEATISTCLSDIHFDEVVLPDSVHGLNEYNPDIATQRVERYFSRLLWVVGSLRRGGRKINRLVLSLLGDNVAGYHNSDSKEQNSMSPLEAKIAVQGLIADGIKFLYERGNFDEIIVVGIFGNHAKGARKPTKGSAGYKNSYDWMIYEELQKLFKEELSGYDNLRFVIPISGIAYIDIYDWVNSYSHGNHFDYTGGVNGLTVPFSKWILNQNAIIPAHRRDIGHWHTYMNIPGGGVNSSVIGFNHYAMEIGAKPEPPRMQMQLIDSKRGYTLNEPIYLIDF